MLIILIFFEDNLTIIPGASLQDSNPPQDNKACSTKFHNGMHDYFLQNIKNDQNIKKKENKAGIEKVTCCLLGQTSPR